MRHQFGVMISNCCKFRTREVAPPAAGAFHAEAVGSPDRAWIVSIVGAVILIAILQAFGAFGRATPVR